MKIKLDDKHYLNSDQWCYWITVEVENKKTGKIYEKRITGYCAKLEDIFEDYIDKKLKSDDINSLKDLVTEIRILKSACTTFANEIEEKTKNLKG